MRLLLATALLTAGCIPAPHGDPVPPLPPQNIGECNAAPAQELMGRRESPALAQDAQRLSGARMVRLLHPGEVVTMEYRGDRVNVHFDADDKVDRIVCG